MANLEASVGGSRERHVARWLRCKLRSHCSSVFRASQPPAFIHPPEWNYLHLKQRTFLASYSLTVLHPSKMRSATQQHVAVFLSPHLFAQLFQFYHQKYIRNTIHNSICEYIQFRTDYFKWYIFLQLLSVLSTKNARATCVALFLLSAPNSPSWTFDFSPLCVALSSYPQLPILPHGQLCKLLTVAIIKPPSWKRKSDHI